MRASARQSWLVPALAVVLTACATEDRADRGFTVHDSAGITVVESTLSAWGEGDGWAVDPTPSLSIGEESGETPYLLSGVVGALRLADGGIVVGDGATQELRFFDPAGRFIHAAGGLGDGPGELWSLRMLERCGAARDTLYAFDLRLRAQRFSESGDWLGALPQIVTPEGGPPSDLSCGDPSRFLVAGWPPFTRLEAGESLRTRSPVRLYDEDGTVVAEYGTFPSWEWVGDSNGAIPHQLSRHLVHAVRAGNVYLGTGDTHEISVFDAAGDQTMILRWAGPDLTFTTQDAARYRSRYLEGPGIHVDVDLGSWFPPETWPAYQTLKIDVDGNLWLKDFDRQPQDGAGTPVDRPHSTGEVAGPCEATAPARRHGDRVRLCTRRRPGRARHRARADVRAGEVGDDRQLPARMTLQRL